MSEKINTNENKETAIAFTIVYFTNAFNNIFETANNLGTIASYTFKDLYTKVSGISYMVVRGVVSKDTTDITVSNEDMHYLKFLKDVDDVKLDFRPFSCGKLALRLLRAIENAPMDYDFTPYGQYLLSRVDSDKEEK